MLAHLSPMFHNDIQYSILDYILEVCIAEVFIHRLPWIVSTVCHLFFGIFMLVQKGYIVYSFSILKLNLHKILFIKVQYCFNHLLYYISNIFPSLSLSLINTSRNALLSVWVKYFPTIIWEHENWCITTSTYLYIFENPSKCTNIFTCVFQFRFIKIIKSNEKWKLIQAYFFRILHTRTHSHEQYVILQRNACKHIEPHINIKQWMEY